MVGGIAALRYLRHPVVVTCLVVWILNDRWLKHVSPGVVTGKLSDLTGLVVFAGLVALVAGLILPIQNTRALGIAAWVTTAVGFTAVKTVPAANHTAVALLDHLLGVAKIALDPTDLVALVALPLAWLIWCRPGGSVVNIVQTGAAWMVAAVALGATTATSCAAVTPRTYVWSANPKTIAFWTRSAEGQIETLSSTDTGLDWTPTTLGLLEGSDGDGAATTEATCIPAALQHCFKVKGDRVLESTNGGHHWVVTWKRPATMPRSFGKTCGGGGQLNAPSQILIVGAGSSAVIVVGIGTDGVLRRSAGASTWQVVNVLGFVRSNSGAEGAESPPDTIGP
jgi:hypothetical protein